MEISVVEEWLVEAATSYAERRCGSILAGDGLMQRLKRRGVRAEEFTFSSAVGRPPRERAAPAAAQRLISLPDDPDLLDELRNVRLRETSPGVLRMDHDADQHDDRAIALALAASKLLDGRTVLATASFTGIRRRSW